MHEHDERPGKRAGLTVEPSRQPVAVGHRQQQALAARQVRRGAAHDVAQCLQVSPYQGARSRNGGTVPAGISIPSCTDGTAHFGEKPTGACERGPLKLETFHYCNELPGVSLPDIKSEQPKSYQIK